MTTLAKTVTRMGQLFFGMLTNTITWCLDADENTCADLLEHIFRSGNFGSKDAQNNGMVYVMSNMRHGFFRTLQKSGKDNWKALKEHPWLEPFAWLYQAARYVSRGFQGKDTMGKVLDNRRRSQDLDDLMQRLDL